MDSVIVVCENKKPVSVFEKWKDFEKWIIKREPILCHKAVWKEEENKVIIGDCEFYYYINLIFRPGHYDNLDTIYD